MRSDSDTVEGEVPLVDDEGHPISESDIVFNCPHCGHSLVIDYRGAGLIINCTECGEQVDVPIPEGMQLEDLDQSPEDQEAQIGNLRRMLAKSEDRAAGLVTELASIREERAKADTACEVLESRLEKARNTLAEILKSQEELTSRLQSLLEILQ